MLKRLYAPFAFVAVAALVTACAAAGPKLATIKESLPALGANQGRLFFYRQYATFGSGMQPDIFVCGKKAGESIPGGVFYVDLPAGECEIAIPAIVFKGQTKLKVAIGTAQVRYLRTSVGAGGFQGFTDVETVPEQVAGREMQELALTNPER